jgi:hypothetical protein
MKALTGKILMEQKWRSVVSIVPNHTKNLRIKLNNKQFSKASLAQLE